MRKIILPLIFGAALFLNAGIPAQANIFKVYKARIEQNKEIKNTRAEIKDLFVKQLEYVNNKNYDKLFDLYSDNFVNNDGFNKKVYFKLIKDTWQSYPDVVYGTTIRDIQFEGNYAAVQTFETALATTHEEKDGIDAYGELTSVANSIYYLQKFGDNWQIVSEQVLSEKSALKYGDARFIKMDLTAPEVVNAGTSYTAALDIDLADDENAIASIDRQIIIYPTQKFEENFRKLSDENTLERMFIANKNNVNEYSMASIGIAKSEIYDETNVRVYVSGIAFLMTRVNVIPENKHIDMTAEENNKDAQETK